MFRQWWWHTNPFKRLLVFTGSKSWGVVPQKRKKKSWEVFETSIFCWKIKQYEKKKKKKLIIFCIRTPSLFPWACVYLIIIIIIINPLGLSSEKSNPSEFQLV